MSALHSLLNRIPKTPTQTWSSIRVRLSPSLSSPPPARLQAPTQFRANIRLTIWTTPWLKTWTTALLWQPAAPSAPRATGGPLGEERRTAFEGAARPLKGGDASSWRHYLHAPLPSFPSTRKIYEAPVWATGAFQFSLAGIQEAGKTTITLYHSIKQYALFISAVMVTKQYAYCMYSTRIVELVFIWI